jgi:hypothetical protein
MSINSHVGLIVEGQTELLAFTRYVPRKNIKIGRRFSGTSRIETIADEIATLARLMPTTCKKVIAIFDREERMQDRSELEVAVKAAVSGVGKIAIEVICPDRMVENWMLADALAWKDKKYIDTSRVKQVNFEGKHGINEIKRIFRKNFDYHKTTHGVELLNLIRSEVAADTSMSYKKFGEECGFID